VFDFTGKDRGCEQSSDEVKRKARVRPKDIEEEVLIP
jgi:hypothetical protein